MPTRVILVSLAMAIVGCDGLSKAVSPLTEGAVGNIRAPLSLEQRFNQGTIADNFARLGETEPGFTGVFFDSTGNLTISVATDSFSIGSRARVLAWARQFAGAEPTDGQVRIRRVRYSYATLRDAYSRLDAMLRPDDDLSSTWIDETRGTIHLGLVRMDRASSLRARIVASGIPEDMLVTEATGPAWGQTTLNQNVRPVLGGVGFLNHNGDVPCTVGFNVLNWNTGIDPNTDPLNFLTAAHCSGSSWGQANSYPVYQDTGTRVGEEFQADPVVNYPNWRCPSSAKSPCEQADAAVMRYDDTVSVSYGNVADVNSSKTITGIFNVQGTVAGGLTGQAVTKIGMVTGKSTGTITASCVDLKYHTGFHLADVWVLCMQRANYFAAGGDSGGPVFVPYTSGNPYTPSIVGIHNATDGSGNRYLTPINNIDMVFFNIYFYQ